jgi:hypothetical protein
MSTTLERPTVHGSYYVCRLDDGELEASRRPEAGRFWSFYFSDIDKAADGWGCGSTPDEAKSAAFRDFTSTKL